MISCLLGKNTTGHSQAMGICVKPTDFLHFKKCLRFCLSVGNGDFSFKTIKLGVGSLFISGYLLLDTMKCSYLPDGCNALLW